MTLLKMAFETVYQIMNIPIDVLGYELTFGGIIIYIILGTMIIVFINNLSD